jgi:hypothetical protein
MYSKLSEASLSRNSRKLNRNQPGESGMLPNWKLRFESCQSQFAPISPKIDALKFDYSAFDDAPAVVPLGIWAFSSLTRAVARVALSDLNHSGSIPLYGRLRVSAEQIL